MFLIMKSNCGEFEYILYIAVNVNASKKYWENNTSKLY